MRREDQLLRIGETSPMTALSAQKPAWALPLTQVLGLNFVSHRLGAW